MTRRLLLPGLSTLVMLAILLGLGTWQVQRLAWKRALLATIDHAEAAPAVALGPTPAAFAKVRVTGTLRPALRALYAAQVRGDVLGGQFLAVLDRPGAAPLLVDLGWLPADRMATLPLPTGLVAIDGFVRPAETARWFSATDSPAERRFYTLDPAAIGAAIGAAPVAPFTLIALGPAPAAGQPDPARHLPRPPNDHLQYALTWYGLAGVLVVIFAIYARKALREP